MPFQPPCPLPSRSWAMSASYLGRWKKALQKWRPGFPSQVRHLPAFVNREPPPVPPSSLDLPPVQRVELTTLLLWLWRAAAGLGEAVLLALGDCTSVSSLWFLFSIPCP